MNLSKMTVPQLDTYAREKGIEFPDDVTTKDAKVDYIKAFEGNDITLNVGGKIFSVPASRSGDIRVVRALRDMDRAQEKESSKEQLFAALDLVDVLFQGFSNEIEEAIREPDGTIPAEKLMNLVNEFFTQANAKNS